MSNVKLSPSDQRAAAPSPSLSVFQVRSLVKCHSQLKPAKLALVHCTVVNAFKGTIKEDMQCTCNVTPRRVRITTIAVVKHWVLHILSILTLFKQHSMCIRRIASSVARLALPHFYTLSHERHDFRKKKKKQLLNIIRILIFPAISVRSISNCKRIQRDIIIYVRTISCKSLGILVRFWCNLSFLYRFSINVKFHECPSSVSQTDPSGRTDRQTDRHRRWQ